MAAAALTGLLLGCADQKVQVYSIPKEQYLANVSVPAEAPAAHQHGAPHVHWKLPGGWVEQRPDRMRVGSFLVQEGEKKAQVAIIPLPKTPGMELTALESVNMWRQELTQDPLTEVSGQEVSVGGHPASLYEIEGQRQGEDSKSRTLGAIHEHDGLMWFIKMTGDADLVTANREKFTNFMATLELHGEDAHSSPKGEAVSTNAGELPPDASQPKWNPPAHWQAKAPGPMLLASYAISGEKGAAELTISKLAGEGGGLAPNVNRWRGQLGLGPASSDEMQKTVTAVEVDGKPAPLVDLTGTNSKTGQPARMLTLVLRTASETWFYKLMGSTDVVAAERENLVKFVEEAH